MRLYISLFLSRSSIDRGWLYMALQRALAAADVPVHYGVDVQAVEGAGGGSSRLKYTLERGEGGTQESVTSSSITSSSTTSTTSASAAPLTSAPFDLVIVATGSHAPLPSLPSSIAPQFSHRQYRKFDFGAAWALLTPQTPEEEARLTAAFDPSLLLNYYSGSRYMLGLMPSGPRGKTTLFWSTPRDAFPSLRACSLEQWKAEVLTHVPCAGPALEFVREKEQLRLAEYGDAWMAPTWHAHDEADGGVVVLGDAGE